MVRSVAVSVELSMCTCVFSLGVFFPAPAIRVSSRRDW